MCLLSTVHYMYTCVAQNELQWRESSSVVGVTYTIAPQASEVNGCGLLNLHRLIVPITDIKILSHNS